MEKRSLASLYWTPNTLDGNLSQSTTNYIITTLHNNIR